MGEERRFRSHFQVVGELTTSTVLALEKKRPASDRPIARRTDDQDSCARRRFGQSCRTDAYARKSNWPLPSPLRNARGASVPPRRKRRNRTSLWPSKIGTRPGDVIKDARLENSSRWRTLPNRRLGVARHRA